MSIKGIRNIRGDNRKGNLNLYESQDLGKNSKIKNSNICRLIELEIPNKSRFLGISRDSNGQTVELDQNRRKGSKIQYETFLDNQIQVKDISVTIHGKPKNSLIDADFISFSSREYRKQPQNSKALSGRSKNSHQITNMQIQKQINKSNFNLEYVVGKGGFGKVWRVKQKKSGRIFAMKQMLKMKVIKKRSVNSVMNEKKLLQKLHHPFIVNMRYAFQDSQNLFLVMDYVNCGDLRYHLCNRRKFTENETKFFIACILVALEYLHSNQIIHRDIKPENLVIDDKGYVKVTDLGVSRQFKQDNASDTSGTPGYMAPEVICKSNHSYTSDYFAVGVIGYQFMLGKRPYVGKNRQQIRQQILAKQMKIEEVPTGWSIQAVDFVNKLIQRKPKNRLGYGGIAQIKSHSWFRGFDWVSLMNKTLPAPFIPLTIQQAYKNYKQCISSDTKIEDEQECKLLIKNKQTQQLFQGYEFNALKNPISSTSTSTSTSTSLSTPIPIKNYNRHQHFMKYNSINKMNQSLIKQKNDY